MNKYLFILFLFTSQLCIAQKIVNAAMVGDNGITEDAKKAKYLIVIKTYADTAFERLEYNFSGPMKRLLTYNDPNLKIQSGPYRTFFATGNISTDGFYVNNKKDGNWIQYNDTGKAVTEYRYHHDTLLAILNIDSLDKERKLERERKKEVVDTTDEREAEYKDGMKKYISFIYKNLKVPDRTQSLEAGGTVRVRFIVNKEGKVTNVAIRKSVEFAFDEEAMRVISLAREWIPAWQRGRYVNAYREQPITISFK